MKVSKLNAATSQLETAIYLWVNDADPISVHTLVAAALQIIHDVTAAKSAGPLLYDIPLRDEALRKTFLATLREPMNSFKHARDDPESVLDFNPEANIHLFLVSIYGLQQLGEKLGPNSNAFGIWLALNKPEFVKREFVQTMKEKIPIDVLEDIKSSSKKQIFLELSKANALRWAQH